MKDEQDIPGIGTPEGVAALVDDLVAIRAQIAALHAREMEVLAAAQQIGLAEMDRMVSKESRDREMPLRAIAASLGCAVRVSDRTMQGRMGQAAFTREHFPVAVDALREGRISASHLNVIVAEGTRLAGDATGDALVEFDRTATGIAEHEFPGRLRPALAVLANRLHPESLKARHARAAEGRGVFVIPLEDGMAELRAPMPAVLAFGIHDRLTQDARGIIDARNAAAKATRDGTLVDIADTEGSADARTLDQVRADVFADLLLTTHPTTGAGGDGIDRIRAEVQILIPVTVLTGTDDTTPAILNGYGPVDPDTARRLAGNAGVWTRVMTHPVSGEVLAIDGYRPTAAQQRVLRFRDGRCRFPGCRQPARRCDIDHSTDFAHGGRTECCNLGHQCERHHTMKHATAWTVRQLRGGVLEWTSPEGRIYTDHPEHTVHFTPTTDPPPF